MRVPSKTLCTVRSTVPVVVLLLGTFILFDSYDWQNLSVSWSQPDSPSFAPFHSDTLSRAASNLTSIPPGLDTEVTLSTDLLSDDDYVDGEVEGEILHNREYSPKNDSVPVDSQLKEEKRNAENDPGAGNHDADSKSAMNPAVAGPDQFPQDSGAAPNSGTGSLEHGQESRTTPDSSALENVGSSRTVQTGESEVATSSKADTVPHDTPSEVIAKPIVAESIQKKPTRRYDELSSLQKVEFDLWQARAAMRRVVLAQINSSLNVAAGVDQSVPDGEPSGDVYRNAAIFRQSYQEMEQRFKVYAYREGEEPLVHNGPCKEIYAVEGRFIQELQGDNPFVTSDPEAAHVFFLPFSVAMMVTYLYTANSGDMSPLLRFVKDYVQVVSHKYPYWTRSEGADHFMLACHDWGPHVSRADQNLVSKTIRVLCNANVSEGYIPSKDASLPEIHLVGGEIPAALGGLPASQRTSLAFFAGADHGPVRPELFKSWEGKDDNIHVYHQVPAEGPSYHEFMKSSKYCLCPGGYEVNSPRLVESIYNECVPVVIADSFVLPFSDVLDWKTFAVHVLEKDIPNLKSILEAIPMETYILMQARVKQVQHHFLMNQPPQRYDVFHMILHSIWLRRLNIRLLG